MPISAEAPWLNYYGAIPRTLNYPRLTIYQLVAQTARECPDLPAYEFMAAERATAIFWRASTAPPSRSTPQASARGTA